LAPKLQIKRCWICFYEAATNEIGVGEFVSNGKWWIYVDCLFSGLSENCVVMKQYSSYRRLITVKPLILEVDPQFVKLTQNTALGISSPESDCKFTSEKNPGFPGHSDAFDLLTSEGATTFKQVVILTSSCSICSKTEQVTHLHTLILGSPGCLEESHPTRLE